VRGCDWQPYTCATVTLRIATKQFIIALGSDLETKAAAVRVDKLRRYSDTCEVLVAGAYNVPTAHTITRVIAPL